MQDSRQTLKQLLRGAVTAQEAKELLADAYDLPTAIHWPDGTYSFGLKHLRITEAEFKELTRGKQVSTIAFSKGQR